MSDRNVDLNRRDAIRVMGAAAQTAALLPLGKKVFEVLFEINPAITNITDKFGIDDVTDIVPADEVFNEAIKANLIYSGHEPELVRSITVNGKSTKPDAGLIHTEAAEYPVSAAVSLVKLKGDNITYVVLRYEGGIVTGIRDSHDKTVILPTTQTEKGLEIATAFGSRLLLGIQVIDGNPILQSIPGLELKSGVKAVQSAFDVLARIPPKNGPATIPTVVKPNPTLAPVPPTEQAVNFDVNWWKDAGTSKETIPDLKVTNFDDLVAYLQNPDQNPLPELDLHEDIIKGRFSNTTDAWFAAGKIRFVNDPSKMAIFPPQLIIDSKLSNGQSMYSIFSLKSNDVGKRYLDTNKRPDSIQNFYLVNFGGTPMVVFETFWFVGDARIPKKTLNMYTVDHLRNYLVTKGKDNLKQHLGMGDGVMSLPTWFKSDQMCRLKAGDNYCAYWSQNKALLKKAYQTWADNPTQISDILKYFPILTIAQGL